MTAPLWARVAAQPAISTAARATVDILNSASFITIEPLFDGRFAMLATIMALVLVRLEQLGEPGNAVSVALTERFIEAMESEHRELGLGDPTLGKTVRKLVGALARRTELWRSAVAGDWPDAMRASVYKGEHSADAFGHSVRALRAGRADAERGSVPA